MFNAGISKLLKKGKKANLLYVASRLRTFILRVLHTWCPGPTSRHRPGTKFSRGWDQVKSAGDGIDRDFEMLPTPGPGPGMGKICRGRDFLNLILKISESFRKLVSMFRARTFLINRSTLLSRHCYTILMYYHQYFILVQSYLASVRELLSGEGLCVEKCSLGSQESLCHVPHQSHLKKLC